MATVNKPPETPAAPDKPKTFMERFGTILAVALAALATVFAGMSAAALQRSMYWKAQAAQDQSKSTNQWSLFGFKRDRSMIMQTNAAALMATCDYEKATLTIPSNKAEDKAYQTAKTWLEGKGPPAIPLPKIENEKITDLMKAIEERHPENELEQLGAAISRDSTKKNPLAVVPSHVTITNEINAAESANAKTDVEWKPITRAANELAKSGEGGKARTARQAALSELEQRRYRAEADVNIKLGQLYDAKVIISAAESDKFYERSTLLSYASMITQVGVVLASLALARKGSFLWILAALIGVVAVGLGGHAMGVLAMIMGTPH